MKVTPLALDGVLLLEPRVFRDERGFFQETFHKQRFQELGLPTNFVQDNHSRSCRGVLRGLHFQLQHPQGKLVRVVSGEIFDVAVDIRPASPTLGQWCGTMLNDQNHHQLWVPPGMAHGFVVLSERADVLYRCTDVYAPDDEYSVRWDDPTIGIKWPLDSLADTPVIISQRDQNAMNWQQLQTLLGIGT
ncbi:dTDP-4-dehydrorhamnose 3,5-epimerase [Parathalassolituus penaei]|uniref:dTDP-4-dehydrorhamnose 3,5-epimerase n=1 Tax=Parathalassolituus penaei TaxID=2997323 RepID=A0A9X3EGV1_9GAMM|nr:dTDP-4-dehydrorhamnose 3,5-epimerase [Parathalassolituus penaei]MCY0966956.1 dTDP-4-dehydrorhamnose 3,5-epimerase [Parathalassolituus penaei]